MQNIDNASGDNQVAYTIMMSWDELVDFYINASRDDYDIDNNNKTIIYHGTKSQDKDYNAVKLQYNPHSIDGVNYGIVICTAQK